MKTTLLPLIPPLLLLVFTLAQTRGPRSGSDDTSAGGAASAQAVLTFQDLDAALLPEVEGGPVEYPAWLAALDGKRVAVAGFMAPFDQLDDLTVFMLMPSYVGCYFCAPPSFTQVLLVRQREEGRTSKRPFIDPPIRVTGVLRLYQPESTHAAHRDQFVYALDDAVCEVVTGPEVPRRASAHGEASPLLGRAKADTPATDPKQPHTAFQPQLLVPGITALRDLPLRTSLRFIKAEPEEILRRLRLTIEAEMPPQQRRTLGRMLVQLGWVSAETDWVGELATVLAEQGVGWVDSEGGRVIYHPDLPLSKPAGRLAIAALIHEALLRQNPTGLFHPAASVDEWWARRAVLHGDQAVLKADYTRRNWLSAPDPLAPLSWGSASPAGSPPLRRWLDRVTQAAERLIRRHRGRDSNDLVNSLYVNPPFATAYFLNPEWTHQQPASLPPAPLAVEGHVLEETRLGVMALLTWLAEGEETHELETLLSRIETERAAFVRTHSGTADLFVWETRWPTAADADAFAHQARQVATQRTLEVVRPSGHERLVLLQATAIVPPPLTAGEASAFTPVPSPR